MGFYDSDARGYNTPRFDVNGITTSASALSNAISTMQNRIQTRINNARLDAKDAMAKKVFDQQQTDRLKTQQALLAEAAPNEAQLAFENNVAGIQDIGQKAYDTNLQQAFANSNTGFKDYKSLEDAYRNKTLKPEVAKAYEKINATAENAYENALKNKGLAVDFVNKDNFNNFKEVQAAYQPDVFADYDAARAAAKGNIAAMQAVDAMYAPKITAKQAAIDEQRKALLAEESARYKYDAAANNKLIRNKTSIVGGSKKATKSGDSPGRFNVRAVADPAVLKNYTGGMNWPFAEERLTRLQQAAAIAGYNAKEQDAILTQGSMSAWLVKDVEDGDKGNLPPEVVAIYNRLKAVGGVNKLGNDELFLALKSAADDKYKNGDGYSPLIVNNATSLDEVKDIQQTLFKDHMSKLAAIDNAVGTARPNYSSLADKINKQFNNLTANGKGVTKTNVKAPRKPKVVKVEQVPGLYGRNALGQAMSSKEPGLVQALYNKSPKEFDTYLKELPPEKRKVVEGYVTRKTPKQVSNVKIDVGSLDNLQSYLNIDKNTVVNEENVNFITPKPTLTFGGEDKTGNNLTKFIKGDTPSQIKSRNKITNQLLDTKISKTVEILKKAKPFLNTSRLRELVKKYALTHDGKIPTSEVLMDLYL